MQELREVLRSLAQEGKCVRVVEAADHFVSSLRWGTSVFKDPAVADGGDGGGGGAGQVNGTPGSGGPTEKEEQIRCLVACGSVDLNVRVFSA